MSSAPLALVRALLHEGYSLYPYRASAPKNHFRFLFGVLFPPAAAPALGESHAASFEVLVEGEEPRLSLEVCYLAPFVREGSRTVEAEMDAAERITPAGDLDLRDLDERVLTVIDANDDGAAPRTVRVVVTAGRVAPAVHRVRIRVENATPLAIPDDLSRAAALLSALATLHVVLRVEGGRMASLLDPPPDLAELASGCRSEGLFPVLVGDAQTQVLASPFVLEDQPRVAPESKGDFFDGLEIDEMLMLRIWTLSDAEKRELAGSDPRVAALLERTERLSEQEIARLHGAVRAPTGMAKGTRVILRPRHRADIFDLALAGKRATVLSVEHDAEGKAHVAVSVDDDPGRDLAARGFPGHRFFFALDEVEVVP